MNKEIIEVPVDKLIAREKMAMMQAKKKEKSRKNNETVTSCRLRVIRNFAWLWILFDTMAAALSNMPFIGSIYKDFGEIASDKIERDQLMTEIEKQDEQNGLTMIVKEAAYDGGRLLVSVAYTGEKEVSLGMDVASYITINGQPIKTADESTGQDDFDSNTIIEHHQITLAEYDGYGDEIEVAIHGEDLFGYEGEWEVAFPLEKIVGDTDEFESGVKAETADGIYAITADKVTFTPLSTRIDLSIDYPVEMDANDTWPWFDFHVVDNNGYVYRGLELLSGVIENDPHRVVLTLPPMDEIPESFTLKPADISNEGGFREEIEELELVVPLIEKN